MSSEFTNNQSYINLTDLYKLVDGDTATLQIVVEEFIETSPDDIKLLNEVITAASYHEIHEIAHKLKATFKYFGISGTNELIAIEKAAQQHLSMEQIKDNLKIVNEGYNGALKEVKLLYASL